MDQSTEELISQFEDFITEVDMIDVYDGSQLAVPTCEWIVEVDDASQNPTYRHVPSNEVVSEMPEEYVRYLSDYDSYVKMNQGDQSGNSQQDDDLCELETYTANDETNTLVGIIVYSDSSGDEQPTVDHRSNSIPDQSVRSADADVFIGPELPPRRTRRSYHARRSRENKNFSKSDSIHNRATIDSDQLTAIIDKLNDQLQVVCGDTSYLSAMQALSIQFHTRLEDWRCGQLSTEYVYRKLKELERMIKENLNRTLPSNWTCHWHEPSKQFFYRDKMTDTSHWNPPTTPFRSRSPASPQVHKAGTFHQMKPHRSRSKHSNRSKPSMTKSNAYQPDYSGTSSFSHVNSQSKSRAHHLQDQLIEFDLVCQQIEDEFNKINAASPTPVFLSSNQICTNVSIEPMVTGFNK